MMGQGHVMISPATPDEKDDDDDDNAEIFVGQQNELEEKEMFSRLEKPRVRYDVEVVTKLVVYTGRRCHRIWRIGLTGLRYCLAGCRSEPHSFRIAWARDRQCSPIALNSPISVEK
jgi:hypothetical protein